MKTDSKPAVLEFRNVSLSFDGPRAIDDVSFSLQSGQLLCLTGSANSGKSVLLRLAIGLLQPDEGQIFVNGREISKLDESELCLIRGSSMGMVFQDESLFTSLSVYDNAAYRLVEHGWPEAEIDRAVREILSFVGLEDEMEKYYEELSGGMKRRVEIARALAGWPSIMLFDEPTSGLDPLNAHQVLDLVIRARDINHIASIYVTKALREIPYLASHYALPDAGGGVKVQEANGQPAPAIKVMLMDHGKIGFFGSPAEFAESEIPAARQMTHPQTGVAHENVWVRDPWNRAQRRGERGASKRV